MLVMEEGVEGFGRYARGVHLSGKAPAEQMGRQATMLKPSSPECPFDYQPRPVIAEGLAVLVAGIQSRRPAPVVVFPFQHHGWPFRAYRNEPPFGLPMVLLLHQPPSHFDQSLPWVAIEEAAGGPNPAKDLQVLQCRASYGGCCGLVGRFACYRVEWAKMRTLTGTGTLS